MAGIGSSACPPPCHWLLLLSRSPPWAGKSVSQNYPLPVLPHPPRTPPAWQQVEQQLDGSRSGESACGPVQYVEKTPNPGLKSKWEAVVALRGAMSWCGLSQAPAQGCDGRRRRRRMIPMLKGLGWVCPAGAEAAGAGVVLGGGGGGAAGPRHCGGGCPAVPRRRSPSEQDAWLMTLLEIMPSAATEVGSTSCAGEEPPGSCRGDLPLLGPNGTKPEHSGDGDNVLL